MRCASRIAGLLFTSSSAHSFRASGQSKRAPSSSSTIRCGPLSCASVVCPVSRGLCGEVTVRNIRRGRTDRPLRLKRKIGVLCFFLLTVEGEAWPAAHRRTVESETRYRTGEEKFVGNQPCFDSESVDWKMVICHEMIMQHISCFLSNFKMTNALISLKLKKNQVPSNSHHSVEYEPFRK